MTNQDLRMILRDITCLLRDSWNYKIYIKKGINEEKEIKVANKVMCIYREQDEIYVLEKCEPKQRGRKKVFEEYVIKEDYDRHEIKKIIIDGIKSCKNKPERLKKTREAKTMLYASDGFTVGQKDVIWSGVFRELLK